MRAQLADLILLIHFAVAGFITIGLALIYLGIAFGWLWIRGFWFRLSHLCAIVFVAGEALVGVACPLTIWEDALRQSVAGQPSFVARWVRRLLFYELPEAAFATIYVVAAAATAIAWALAPPRRSRG